MFLSQHHLSHKSRCFLSPDGHCFSSSSSATSLFLKSQKRRELCESVCLCDRTKSSSVVLPKDQSAALQLWVYTHWWQHVSQSHIDTHTHIHNYLHLQTTICAHTHVQTHAHWPLISVTWDLSQESSAGRLWPPVRHYWRQHTKHTPEYEQDQLKRNPAESRLWSDCLTNQFKIPLTGSLSIKVCDWFCFCCHYPGSRVVSVSHGQVSENLDFSMLI